MIYGTGALQKKYLKKEIGNIKVMLSRRQLERIFSQIDNGEKNLHDICIQYGFDLQALNILYMQHVELLNKIRESFAAKPIDLLNDIQEDDQIKNHEDQYYPTKNLIKNLVVYEKQGSNKLKVVYRGLPSILVPNTKFNRDKYKEEAYSQGRVLCNAVDRHITLVDRCNNLNISEKETFLYKKWKLYFLIESVNDIIKDHIKTIDFESHEIVKEKIITFQKLNSDSYTIEALKEDCDFLIQFYENRVPKKSR